MIKYIYHNAISCTFILLAIADARCLYLIDVRIIHTHQAEALPRSEFADAVMWLGYILFPARSDCYGASVCAVDAIRNTRLLAIYFAVKAYCCISHILNSS